MDSVWIGGALILAAGASWLFIDSRQRASTSHDDLDALIDPHTETPDPTLDAARERVRLLLSRPQYSSTFAASTVGTAALTRAVSDLLGGRIAVDSPSVIDAALESLDRGDTEPTEALFSEIAARGDDSSALALRHLIAVSGLRDDSAALAAYRTATERDANGAEAWTMLGLVLDRSSQTAQAQQAFETVLGLEAAGPCFKVSAHQSLARLHLAAHAAERVIEHAESAIPLAIQTGSTADLAQLYHDLGCAHMLREDHDRAQQAFRSALETSAKNNDKLTSASVFSNLGLLHSARGEQPKAQQYLERALQITADLGNKEGHALLCEGLGQFHWDRRRFDQALEYFQKQLTLETELQSKTGMLAAYRNIGIVYLPKGQFEDSIEVHEKYLALATELDRKADMSNAHNNLALTHRMPKGNTDLALQHALKSRDLSNELGDARTIAHANQQLAEVYELQGEKERARECLRHSIQLCEQIDAPDEAHDYRNALARLSA